MSSFFKRKLCQCFRQMMIINYCKTIKSCYNLFNLNLLNILINKSKIYIYNPKIYSFSPDMLQEFLFNLATINNELTQNRSKFCVKFLLYFCMKSILKKHHLKNIGII